jgi:putative membrane protein (TIGR04086 family)
MKNNMIKILIGTAISILLTLIALLIFSMILAYTNVGEETMETVIIGITGISILAGSSVATSKIKKRGIINGILIGALYIILIYMVSSILNKNYSINQYAIIMSLVGMLSGAVGGIVGVNKK